LLFIRLALLSACEFLIKREYDLKALGAKHAASIQVAVTQRLICRKEAKNNEKKKLIRLKDAQNTLAINTDHPDKSEEKTFSKW
jgi:hypothetical protein